MKHFSTGYGWMDQLMPEGMLIPSSTLISGPGGSGKPLIGLAIVASWLRQGGKVVFVPLQFPSPSFIEADLATLYDVRVAEYTGSTFFIKFDLTLDAAGGVNQTRPNEVSANLVNPAVWDRALEIAVAHLGPSKLGTLVFGSALNLLLFSPTFGQEMLARLQTLLREPKSHTYLFTVSSSALREMIATLEDAADNLLLAEMKAPEKTLELQVVRSRGVSHLSEVITVPFERDKLKEMKELADTSRVAKIHAIRQF